jgi:hypothetical protein
MLPESYKFVLPDGNGIPLSEEYSTRESFINPKSVNSLITIPTPVINK